MTADKFSKMPYNIPDTQTAVQLTGPDKLTLNTNKPVHQPGAYQILCQVEVVGLCFSDLKLLKQFTSHVRKSEVVSGIEQDILKEIPCYVPGQTPAVPGHETVVRVCAMGGKVTGIEMGGRYLVQADYRWLKTAESNAAFGYNFEGALQEYVLMDQRVITDPQGESMLIPASDRLSASAIALVEPWACVENAYAVKERACLKENGQMLVVADEQIPREKFTAFLERFGRPARITLLSKSPLSSNPGMPVAETDDISKLSDAGYDDVIYFGVSSQTARKLFAKVAAGGLFNIILCGKKFNQPVTAQVGRVHYGNIRIIGTTGTDPSESMQYIPFSGEIRKGDKINVIGAAGPMGVMHVVRNICQGIESISVFAGDLDNDRLSALNKIAEPLAEKNNVGYRSYNPGRDKITDAFDYTVLMAPVPKLVSASVETADPGGIINIFAGIPANVSADIDFDTYIERHLYFIGTSGSTLQDMKTVLQKVESGRLDTNISAAAVCGPEQVIEGIRAVEKRAKVYR
jgi:threonine dehydrogenase-like Zn-dependent dehydrogenase